jgi:hypothetical protein
MSIFEEPLSKLQQEDIKNILLKYKVDFEKSELFVRFRSSYPKEIWELTIDGNPTLEELRCLGDIYLYLLKGVIIN